MPTKELLPRLFFSFAWAHFRRGYGLGTSFLLGIFNALNIVIIGLKVFIPSFSLSMLLLLYALGFVAIRSESIAFDFLLLRLHFTQAEYTIGTRDNPLINKPIGDKEILGYMNSLAGLDREIASYEAQIAILGKLGLDDKVGIYERNIESAREYKAKLEEMLKR
jgi:hypothetical protein